MTAEKRKTNKADPASFNPNLLPGGGLREK